MSKNLPLHCLFYVTMNIHFYSHFKIARDVVTGLLTFVKIYHSHIFTRIYKDRHTQAHMYDQHTSGIATTRHKNMVGRGGRNVSFREKAQTPKKKLQHTDISNLKKILANRASSKGTRLFLTK